MKLIKTILAFALVFISLNVNAQETPSVQPNDSLEIEILKMLNEMKWGYFYGEDGKSATFAVIKDPIKLENNCLIFNFENLKYKSVNIIENKIANSTDAFDNPVIWVGNHLLMIRYPLKSPAKKDKNYKLANEQTMKLFNLLQNYQDLKRAPSLEEFKIQSQKFLEMSDKPTVTEEQRKFIVQANAQNEAKNYSQALELYKKAIRVNQFSYPSAYYNMALISAQLKDYNYAIFNMKKYLIIEPNAPDARAAQDKIYEWELSIGK